MFNINDFSTDGLGLYFKKDSIYNEFLKLPKPKERFFNDWKDEHGKDYDETSPTYYEPLQYQIQCYLIADYTSDLINKRSQILSLISNPAGFTIYSNTLGRGFHLRYIDSPSFRNLNPIWSQGKLYCEFTLVLENNFNPTEVEYELSDEENFMFTENDEQIIVTDLTQEF